MGWPKQPGQDAEAHLRLAQRHLELVQEKKALERDNAELRAALDNLCRAVRNISVTGWSQDTYLDAHGLLAPVQAGEALLRRGEEVE